MALGNFDTRILKIIQATHHQGDIKYGMLRGIQCSCMSLMSVCWTLFKSESISDSFDLDYILQKEDLLFKSLNKYRYLGIENLPHEFYTENLSVNVEFLNIRAGEITAGTYLVSITEIVTDCQQIGTGALLIINTYILGLLWRNQCFSLFDSNSKDKIGRMLATGTAVLLTFDSLQSLENHIKAVYYSNYRMTLRMLATGTAVLLTFDSLQSLENHIKAVYYSNYRMTLYFQVQFLKLKCADNAKSKIKNPLKSERKKKKDITKDQKKNARS